MLNYIEAFTASGKKDIDISCTEEKKIAGASVFYLDALLENDAFLPDCGLKIGLEPGNFECFTAIEHHSEFWCRPAFGENLTELPKKIQLLLLKSGNEYRAILPLCGWGYTSFLSGADGTLVLNIFSGAEGLNLCKMPSFAVADANNPYEAVGSACDAAAEIFGIKPRAERKYPEIFEYMGWCSWDAMEIWINQDWLLDKCREIEDKKVPIKWGILDDMWADVEWEKKLPPFTSHSVSFGVMHHSKMKNFDGDPERFPEGLAGCISEMNKHGIRVGIWHTMNGYWSGLAEGSEADKKLAGCTLKNRDGQILPDLTDRAKAEKYYNTIHRHLAECGAEFVKIDNQSSLRKKYAGVGPVETLAKNLHEAAENSVDKYFDGAIINCMGMANENMFNRRSAISRCSDDFQPENRSWFSKHLLQCTFSGLLQGHYYVNDFDMWWTDDSQAKKNSLLRAVSGGPIYVSDKIGRTVKEILEPLCFSDGRICRCERSAVPSSYNLFGSPTCSTRAFEVVNTCNGSVTVAAFNINEQNAEVSGQIDLQSLGLEGEYVLYDWFGGNAKILTEGESYGFSLKDNDSMGLFILKKKEKITLFGLADKFISPAAIISENSEQAVLYEPGRVVWFDGSLHITDSDGTHFNKTKSAD